MSTRIHRRGYTLIEVMIVIAIMALLFGFTALYARKTYLKVMQKGVIIEMENMSKGLENYRASNKQYPPCMGALSNSVVSGSSTMFAQGITSRESMFDAHIKARWPRAMNMNYATLQQYLLSGTAPYNYNYQTSTGSVGKLSLDTLDQAEAFVFWLGGFPSPVASGQPISSSKLIGFNNDPQYPFRLAVNPATVTALVENRSGWSDYFPFNQGRLVDIDNDGWLEYRPSIMQGDPQDPAPIVYFDAATYMTTRNRNSMITFVSYPPLSTKPPYSQMSAALEGEWGVACPYAQDVQSNGTIMWHRPQSYQLIAAGLDGKYGTPGEQSMYVPLYPDGSEWVASGGSSFNTQGGMDPEGEDNLTSFADSILRDGFSGR